MNINRERKNFSLATALFAAALLAAGCARTPDEGGAGGAGGGVPDGGTIGLHGQLGYPFGSHKISYAGGVIRPSGVVAEIDDKTAAAYDRWKAAYLVAGCGDGRSYVRANPTNPASSAPMVVSEGQGYGMLITAVMAGHDPGAQASFDGLYRFFRDHPSRGHRDLMAWSQGTDCRNSSTEGANSATDGDLDIGYALLLADRQWGSDGTVNYFGEALRVLDAVLRRDVHQTTNLTLLGDWVGGDPVYSNASRTSDWMLGHFAAFARATQSPRWLTVLEAHQSILPRAQNMSTGLVPDFLVGTAAGNPAPAPPMFLEGQNDGFYAYNACRVPWRLGSAYVLSGDARLGAALTKLSAWVRGKTAGDPAAIVAGYHLDGTAFRDWSTMAFTAPFGVGAMADASNQAWLDALWGEIVRGGDEGYYEDSIRLLSMIVLSGNWWAP
ncbi:MAG TPA: glycosyl hydrolase family 8 [Polyangia bacterium]|jgi:endo-1,4-beta-D-glucanase Y|nr:glycosyl hydrolase family 8 [Polyangia bacterium]